ncbi:STAS domain-containing protein [Sulfuritalea sp.]|jgi:anti-sigma B factor antagonist|uniref:STAS domain-containing protein n=1 Tax=Sulfuritalea sp. TaxID=2480090 RepID=UPI001AD2B567|nr:STAS domain-containing protein [Sulfuritalea sp.]MBN8474800.1 STAS domain-containing protein [Sulfuritalea sp.]
MEFTTQAAADGAMRMAIDGDLNIYHADEIKRRLIDGIRGNAVLELDLSRVGEMDSAGFQLLALAKQEGNQLDHALRIVGHGPAVREVIEFFNMAAFFGDPLVIPAGEQA